MNTIRFHLNCQAHIKQKVVFQRFCFGNTPGDDMRGRTLKGSKFKRDFILFWLTDTLILQAICPALWWNSLFFTQHNYPVLWCLLAEFSWCNCRNGISGKLQDSFFIFGSRQPQCFRGKHLSFVHVATLGSISNTRVKTLFRYTEKMSCVIFSIRCKIMHLISITDLNTSLESDWEVN